MKKNNRESARMAGYISEFLHEYAPQFMTSSDKMARSVGRCHEPHTFRKGH